MALNPPYKTVLAPALNGWQEYPTVATEETAENQQYKPVLIGQEDAVVIPSSKPATALANAEALANQVEVETPEVEKILTPEQKALAEVKAKRQAERATFQEMLNQYRAKAEKQRTADSTMAKYNALGNLLTTMVQPIGWVAGGGKGVTAGVQPYDERQYLEAFNRAVKASDDLRNIDRMEMQQALDFAKRDTQRAEAEYDYQKRRNESNEDYFKRLDYKMKVEGEDNYNARRTAAVKAYYQMMHDRNIHKSALPTFREFINMDGYGKDFFGDWKPSDAEVAQIETTAAAERRAEEVAAESGSPATKGASTGRPATKPAVNTQPSGSVSGLTDYEKSILAKYGAADANKDGKLDKGEREVWNSNHPNDQIRWINRNLITSYGDAFAKQKKLEEQAKAAKEKKKASQVANGGGAASQIFNSTN